MVCVKLIFCRNSILYGSNFKRNIIQVVVFKIQIITFKSHLPVNIACLAHNRYTGCPLATKTENMNATVAICGIAMLRTFLKMYTYTEKCRKTWFRILVRNTLTQVTNTSTNIKFIIASSIDVSKILFYNYNNKMVVILNVIKLYSNNTRY